MSDRHFLVQRNAHAVVIREIDPAQHPLHMSSEDATMNREQAWAWAQKIAMPAQRAQDPKRRVAVGIVFRGIDGQERVVATAQAMQDAWEARNREQQPQQAEPQPTEKQIAFMESLIATRVAADKREVVRNAIKTRRQASALIEALKDCPIIVQTPHGEAQAPQQESVDVPAGRYALVNDDDVVKFYRVDRPVTGRWAGYTFVKVQASDDLYPVKNAADRQRILAAIAVDPRKASILYGKEIGACGVCGKTLTDPESIANGIGPVCAKNKGW